MNDGGRPHHGAVILAGPSGSGKSHLAERLGWPVLRLDDFYREGDCLDLPRSTLGIVDWDDPRSWDAVAAIDAIVAVMAAEELHQLHDQIGPYCDPFGL